MADVPALSERELEIMRRVVTGASNGEIAHALGIRPNTVKVHLRNIYDKLEVQSRTEATTVVVRRGWISLDGDILTGRTVTTALPLDPTIESSNGVDTSPPVVEETSPAPILASATAPEMSLESANLAESVAAGGLSSAPTIQRTEQAALVAPHTVSSAGAPAVIYPTPAPVAAPRPAPSWGMLAVATLLGALVVAVIFLLVRQPETPASAPVVVSTPNRWEQREPLPASRSVVLAAAAGQTLLAGGGAEGETVTETVWAYDPANGAWEERAPLPVPVREAATLYTGGAWWVVGGVTTDGALTDSVQRYDPTTDEWVTESNLPLPLARGAVAAFEGALYFCGGWDGEAVRGEVYRLASGASAWEEVATLPEPRATLAAAGGADGIILLGGVDGDEQAAGEVWLFNPRTGEFTEQAPLPAPDAQPRVASLGSALYVLGQQGFLERTPEQEWRVATLPETPLPSGAALVASDPYILLIGGERGGEPVAEVWQYQAIYRSFIPLVPNQEVEE